MFAALAKFAKKYRFPIIILWTLAAAASFIFAPSLSDVGITDDSQFLPQDTESSYARNLLEDKFATEEGNGSSSGIIVIYREEGLTEDDFSGAAAISAWLASEEAPDLITSVTSPTDSEALYANLVSADETTLLVVMNFSAEALDEVSKEALTQIRQYLHDEHPELNVYVSGKIGMLNDLFSSILDTIDRTTLVTIGLVLVLLLIIYRSPVAALLPLFSIGCSFLVSRGILGVMADSGLKISTLADAYLVVTTFGIGTDYCLFIVSRFREELTKYSRDIAQPKAMAAISPVIAASAITVIVGFLSLGISRFDMNRTTGYALAIGVAITLAASLTLIPALMSIFGKKLFWPGKAIAANAKGSGYGWSRLGRWVTKYPIIVAVVIIAIMIIPYSQIGKLTRSADIVNQMPQDAESVQGYNILKEHFVMGEFSPQYLVIESPGGNLAGEAARDNIRQVAASLEATPGVSRVDYYAAPAADLAAMATQVRAIGDGLGQGIPDAEQLAGLQDYGDALTQMAIKYPAVLESANFQQAAAILQQVGAAAGQLQGADITAMAAILAQVQQGVYQLADSLDGLRGEFLLEADTAFSASLRDTYFATDGSAARINIILADDPYSTEAQDTVGIIREKVAGTLAECELGDCTGYVGGESATNADIMATNDADFGRIMGVVSAGILVVIIILLRSLIAPLYMIVTVLLNYGTTIGIATWLFLDVLDQGSMIYMIPIFVLVILVALGADYNIFLISRIREETQLRSPKEAVSEAVAHTGGVITACGVILAGTFATLMTAPLQIVFQVGAAIALGIIFDTFVVRAILVPCLAVIAGRWSWWPSRITRKAEKTEKQD